MKPGRYDLDLYRGDTAKWIIKLWTDSSKTVPVNLTGATLKAEYRNQTGGTPIVALTAVLTVPNIINLTFPAAAWATAPMGGVWDLQITMPDASIYTVLAGVVKVTTDVTDSV